VSGLRGGTGHTDAERGTVALLVALMVFVLLGMAAFSVDFGWIYYNHLQVRKAAEAAALAGVVHMPLPNCADPSVGTEPYDTALTIAGINGYIQGVGGVTITPSKGANCAQLTVQVSTSIPTFFMNAFGISTVSVTEKATAEQLPPLKIGSDEPYLGEDPTMGSRNRDFFLAISGLDRGKGQGDAYAALFYDGSGYRSNAEYRSPPYYYAVEILPTAAALGQQVSIQVYDGVTHDSDGPGNGNGQDGPTYDWEFGQNVGSPRSRAPGSANVTRFRVFAPDSTPSDWTDNSNLLCSKSYKSDGASGYNPSDENRWDTICTISSAQAGYYVVEVSVSGYTNVINGYSLRGLVNGSANNDLQIYGLGAMSLWQFDTGSNPIFKIVRVDDIYAGQELMISLWDISDIGRSATLQFINTSGGPINGVDCQVRQRSESGSVIADWHGDSGAGTGQCYLSFSNRQYNNQWLDFRFEVPGDYTCTGAECWMYVSYGVSGTITDRTTWTARINGQPIHLVP